MGSVLLVSIAVGEKRVALQASVVVEVVRAVAIVALPKAPEIVEGVINVRGALMPALDLRRRFGIPPRPVAPDQHLVIARAGPRTVALRVDGALDLVEVDEAAIEEGRRVAPGAEYVAGIARLADGLLVIHDLAGFLSLDEAERVDAAMPREATVSPAGVVVGELEASRERIRQVLEERARALARPVARPEAGETLELMTFALANELYGIESRYVVEVFRLKELSPLPGAEQPVFGVTAWRGELLTILDLRPVLGLSTAALNDLTRVMVLGEERPKLGVLADAVLELITLPASEVQAPSEGAAAKRDYLRGVTPEAVLVLEGQRLLRLTEA